MSPSTETPAPTQTITSEYRCVGCGYELKGLKPTGLCPECGWPVSQTLEHFRLQERRGRRVPSFVRIVRVAGFAAFAVLVIIEPVVRAYPPRWTVRDNYFHDSVTNAMAIVFVVGLANALVGLRYRNGAEWLMAWIAYSFLAGILSPAYGR